LGTGNIDDAVDKDRIRELVLKGVDAARSAGAAYADARLTRSIVQRVGPGGIVTGDEELAVGVRCLIDGYWGFAASPFWTLPEMGTLAAAAVAQAKTNAKGSPRRVELGTPPVATGDWIMPVQYDPFSIPLEERIDFLDALLAYIRGYGRVGFSAQGLELYRQERALASSHGSCCTQTVYRTSLNCVLTFAERGHPPITLPFYYPHGQIAGLGWEHILDAKLIDQVPALVDEGHALLATPVKPLDVGRYPVIFDTPTMASLLTETFGTATELDRALGYEANAGGTSYLGPDPLAQLGTTVAARGVTVMADRSVSGGLDTVRWDAEGVRPEDVPLVANGTLVDFQTTCEQAAWLAPWYQSQGRAVRSHGYASAESALSITMQHRPNLSLVPNPEHVSFDDLVATVKRGFAVVRGGVSMDFQARSGQGEGLTREIVNGKLGAIVPATWSFTSSEIWKNVSALGGAASVQMQSARTQKGQPEQNSQHSVRAVPARVENMVMIDPTRRAYP
jgi:TldD protein